MLNRHISHKNLSSQANWIKVTKLGFLEENDNYKVKIIIMMAQQVTCLDKMLKLRTDRPDSPLTMLVHIIKTRMLISQILAKVA